MNNCKWFLKYNALKLQKEADEKALVEHIGKLVKELAEAQTNIELMKVKDKNNIKLLKQYKEKIKEIKGGQKCI